jgi:ABC-2 type transport system permease protein
MSAPPLSLDRPLPPLLPEPVPSVQKTLRRLFLILFLRGRGLRGLSRRGAPKSIAEKLALTLGFYLLFGCMALFFARQPVFVLAVYLHAMTFVFLGMFIASSAGEILFNNEEADILLHRPIHPRVMLWSKTRVLVEVSLWLAGAFNLVGLFVGLASHGNWRFPLIHLVSTALEAQFCTACVVLVYQLCLRWFGRERLEGLMTLAQVLVSIAAVLSGQLLPQLIFRMDRVLDVGQAPWGIYLLPPAWFAGLDDALSGSGMAGSWWLGAAALGATALALWTAFSKLARDYETAVQALGERVSKPAFQRRSQRWLDRLVSVPPLSWWLRDPVARASFLLTAAYLVRDRDVKLRVYPGIAPVLILPFVFLLQEHHRTASASAGFGIPFAGIYLGMVPLFALQMLEYSQQWQAADVFRAAPMPGPAPLCHGARRAVICLLAAPTLLLVGLIVWLLRRDLTPLLLFLPGIIALPVFAIVPQLGGHGIPFSLPTDAAKAAKRGLNVIGVMFVAFALSALTSFTWSHGWFAWMLLGEGLVAAAVYFAMRRSVANSSWPSAE